MDNWIKGTYYVNKLHPSIQCLIWKYGALDERQEYKYIHEKMSRMNREAKRDDRFENLACLVVVAKLISSPTTIFCFTFSYLRSN